MATEYSKKINTSLTEDDFKFIEDAADKDRRSTAQYASILLEQAITTARLKTGSTKAKENA